MSGSPNLPLEQYIHLQVWQYLIIKLIKSISCFPRICRWLHWPVCLKTIILCCIASFQVHCSVYVTLTRAAKESSYLLQPLLTVLPSIGRYWHCSYFIQRGTTLTDAVFYDSPQQLSTVKWLPEGGRLLELTVLPSIGHYWHCSYFIQRGTTLMDAVFYDSPQQLSTVKWLPEGGRLLELTVLPSIGHYWHCSYFIQRGTTLMDAVFYDSPQPLSTVKWLPEGGRLLELTVLPSIGQ